VNLRRLVLLCVSWLAATSLCQAGAEISGIIGFYRPFLDESPEFLAGAAVRAPLTRRFAVRPEFLANSQSYHSDQLVIASVTFDVTDPERRAVMFVSGGGGFVRTHDKRINYTYYEGTGLAGVGVRVAMGERWTAGGEFRLGSNAFPQVTFSVGIRVGRR
jgi:hypothetical protein